MVDLTVKIVEHSAQAEVCPGDPAYDLCMKLRRIGYADIVLPLSALLTGQPTDGDIPEFKPTTTGISYLDVIDAAEQMKAAREHA
ncbi:MAG: hypothetical protein E6Q97_30925 [Desulfurellales bacterium]|nr:MAG: hypothetical protein E6Q97_30925 [Desulfurellales bacterium]